MVPFEEVYAINKKSSVVATHVPTPHLPVLLLHLQRHLLACDARNDNEIMNQERHTSDTLDATDNTLMHKYSRSECVRTSPTYIQSTSP